MELNSWIWKACYLIALALFVAICNQQKNSLLVLIVFVVIFLATFRFMITVKIVDSWPTSCLHVISLLPSFLLPIIFIKSSPAQILPSKNVDSSRTNSRNSTQTVLSALSPVVSDEISLGIKFLLKDFVRQWYENISDDEEFMKSLTVMLEQSVLLLNERLKKVNKYDAVKQIINVYHWYVLMYSKCIKSVQAKLGKYNVYSEHVKICEELSTVAATYKYNADYWANVTSVLLQMLCSSENLKVCELFNNTGFTTVIHNQLVLPLLETLTDSDWLYEALIILLSDEKQLGHRGSSMSDCSMISRKNSIHPVEHAVEQGDVHHRSVMQKSSSLPSLSMLEYLYNERFFKQYMTMETNSIDVPGNSDKFGSRLQCQSSLPDVNNLAKFSEALTMDSSESSQGNLPCILLFQCKNVAK